MPKNSTPTDQNPATLEKKLTELDKIVTKMEAGDLPLDKALQQFEQGITCIRDCQKILNEAEQRVEVLMQENETEKNDD